MSIVVPGNEADTALSLLHEAGEDAYIIGRIEENGNERIRII